MHCFLNRYSDEFERLQSNPNFRQYLVTLDKSQRLPEMLLHNRNEAYLHSEYSGQKLVTEIPQYRTAAIISQPTLHAAY